MQAPNERNSTHLKHAPLDALAAALLGDLAEVSEEALAEAELAVLGNDVEVLKLES
jgi:hypothetical protein